VELESTKEIVNVISAEFEGLLPLLKTFEKVKKGKLSRAEFDDFVINIKDDRKNFLITKKEIIATLEQDYIPVYNEITSFNERIDGTNNIQKLTKIKDELSNRYDIPNRQFLADLIEKKRRKIGSESLPKHTLKIPFENFMELVSKDCPSLCDIIKIKFNYKFDPAFLKTEILADLGESEFSLTMEKLNEGSGKYSLRFIYQGKEDNPVYKFLSTNNV